MVGYYISSKLSVLSEARNCLNRGAHGEHRLRRKCYCDSYIYFRKRRDGNKKSLNSASSARSEIQTVPRIILSESRRARRTQITRKMLLCLGFPFARDGAITKNLLIPRLPRAPRFRQSRGLFCLKEHRENATPITRDGTVTKNLLISRLPRAPRFRQSRGLFCLNRGRHGEHRLRRKCYCDSYIYFRKRWGGNKKSLNFASSARSEIQTVPRIILSESRRARRTQITRKMLLWLGHFLSQETGR